MIITLAIFGTVEFVFSFVFNQGTADYGKVFWVSFVFTLIIVAAHYHNLKQKGVTSFTKDSFSNNQNKIISTTHRLDEIQTMLENDVYQYYYDFKKVDKSKLTFKTKMAHLGARDRIVLEIDESTTPPTLKMNSRAWLKPEIDYGRNLGNLNRIEQLLAFS
jgi:hypothetical protein